MRIVRSHVIRSVTDLNRLCFLKPLDENTNVPDASELHKSSETSKRLAQIERLPDLETRMNALRELYAEGTEKVKERISTLHEGKKQSGAEGRKLVGQLEEEYRLYEVSLKSSHLTPEKRTWSEERMRALKPQIEASKGIFLDEQVTDEELVQVEVILRSLDPELLEITKRIAETMVAYALEKSAQSTTPLERQKPWDDVFKPVLDAYPEFKGDETIISYVHTEIYRQLADQQIQVELDHLNNTPGAFADVVMTRNGAEKTVSRKEQVITLFLESRLISLNKGSWDTPQKMAEGLMADYTTYVAEKLPGQKDALSIRTPDELATVLHQLLQEGRNVPSDEEKEHINERILRYRTSPSSGNRAQAVADERTRLSTVVRDNITNNTVAVASMSETLTQAQEYLDHNTTLDKPAQRAIQRILKGAFEAHSSDQHLGTAPPQLTYGILQSALNMAPSMREIANNPLKYAAFGAGLVWGGLSLVLNNIAALQNLYQATAGVVIRNITLNPLSGFGTIPMLTDWEKGFLGNFSREIIGFRSDGKSGLFGNLINRKNLLMTTIIGGGMLAITHPEATKTLINEVVASEPVTSATQYVQAGWNTAGEGLSAAGQKVGEVWDEKFSRTWHRYTGLKWGEVTDKVLAEWDRLGVNVDPMKKNHEAIGKVAETIPGINIITVPIASLNSYARAWDGESRIPKQHLDFILGQNTDRLGLHLEDGPPRYIASQKFDRYKAEQKSSYLDGVIDLHVLPKDIWGGGDFSSAPVTYENLVADMKDSGTQFSLYLGNTWRNMKSRGSRFSNLGKAVDQSVESMDTAKVLAKLGEKSGLLSTLDIRPDDYKGELDFGKKRDLLNIALIVDLAEHMLSREAQATEPVLSKSHWQFYGAMRDLKQNVATGDPSWYEGTAIGEGGMLESIGAGGSWISQRPFQGKSFFSWEIPEPITT